MITNRIQLSSMFSPQAMSLNLVSAQRDEVLRELVDLVPSLAGRDEDRARLHRALVEREQLHSTGIGDGIAIPHARNALVGLVDTAILVFGRHPAGVHFGSIDGSPAHLFFLLAAPNVTTHLAILARLSRLLRDKQLRSGLLKAEKPEKVVALISAAEQALQAQL